MKKDIHLLVARRVTLVAAFGFFPQYFGKVAGPTNSVKTGCTPKQWGALKYLARNHSRPNESPGENFTTYFFFFFSNRN